MIPGGFAGIAMNTNEGGEPSISTPVKGMIKKNPNTNMQLVPTTNELAIIREKVVKRYEKNPLASTSTFTGVLKAKTLNAKITNVKKSALPVENFDIIGSEKYFEPPVLWQTSIGLPARLFGRSDAIRYNR